MKMEQTIFLIVVILTFTGVYKVSGVCTDADIQNCYGTCNYNLIQQWALNGADQSQLNYPLCKARSDCYNCLTAKLCVILPDALVLYQSTQQKCDSINSSISSSTAVPYNSGRSSHDTYMSGVIISLFTSLSIYYLHN